VLPQSPGQAMYVQILQCIRVITTAVEKQQVLHILSVCL